MATLVYLDYIDETLFDPLDLSDWRCRPAASEEKLLDQILAGSVDAVLLRVEGDNLKALSFARKIADARPDLVRILLSWSPSARYITEANDVVDTALSAQCDPAQVSHAIERAQNVKSRIYARKFDSVSAFLNDIPPLPAKIDALNAMIDSRINDNAAMVAPLFKGQLEYMKAVMALVNNPLFGSKNLVFSAADAVKLVGLRTFRDLCILVHVQNILPQPEGFDGFSFDASMQRSLKCGKFAEQVAKTVASDRVHSISACAAGFFLDIGGRALVSLDPQRYFHVMERAAVLRQPIYAVEKLEYNLTRGEMGAAILNRWGVSPRTVRAVLYHHVPQASDDTSYTALAAVHVSDALLKGVKNKALCNLAGRLSTGYLDQIGEMDRRAHWEELAEQFAERYP
ncbi:HDOD domain-containing protein [Marinobacterium lutimaris]|uniref:HD-like signal output (HDOD) domain, no enzymatic activity n=1 Tax=Marinobacterium lutimaris TaxID=568106 RepID=A0A1H5YEW9_9GAMM|nr:HDOD domain-containing protein [Marinobacterium lutimaris]SEG22649.1 HD-like signal output (HDOD) domain, no enzymatic activity [Marinobacterium lutimaris]